MAREKSHTSVGGTQQNGVTQGPSLGHSLFNAAASGMAECFGNLTHCPPDAVDSGGVYHFIGRQPSSQFDNGTFSVETSSPSNGANWMNDDGADATAFMQEYPALQPTALGTINIQPVMAQSAMVQPTMVQPSTRFEEMYYPDDEHLADLLKTEEADTEAMVVNMEQLQPAELVPHVYQMPPPFLEEDFCSAHAHQHLHSEESSELYTAHGMLSDVEARIINTNPDIDLGSQLIPSPAHFPIHSPPVISPHSAIVPYHTTPAPMYGPAPRKNPRPAPAKRGPFKDQLDRQKTAQTRKIGSCIRCRMQRIRCVAGEGHDPNDCECCRKASTRSWRLPCLRLKIGDVKLAKICTVKGYEWTLRWRPDPALNSVGSWASSDIKIIRVTEGYTGNFVEFRVREFIPQPGDKLERSWVTPTGETRSVHIPAYAIIDPSSIAAQYRAYIRSGLSKCCDHVLHEQKGTLIWWTYDMAMRLSREGSRLSPLERKVLSDVLDLWMAVRLTTTSFEIVGQETLGMPRDILDETNPSCGKIPLPPVMGAQLDSVLIHVILKEMQKRALDGLHKIVIENKTQTWLTVYLAIFILLHNTALLMKHDASYARKHGMNRRFARPEKVEEYNIGAITLLAYFHYCNKGAFPFSKEAKENNIRNLASLDDSGVEFMRQTRRCAIENQENWQALWDNNAYENDYFFISQLYEANWLPRNMGSMVM